MSNTSDKHINKINDVMKFIERKLTCDSDCEREQNIEKLRKKWKESEEKLKILPNRILENEKNFFLANNGEEYYENNVLRKRYINQVKLWREDQLKKFNEIHELMEITLSNYSSQSIAKSRIKQLLKQVRDKNETLKKQIDDYYKRTLTAERRVWYQQENNDNLGYWKFYIIIFHYTVGFLYLFLGPFLFDNEYKNWKVWLQMIIYLLSPLIFPYLISFFIYLYSFLEIAF
tara:strand:+ start:7137 stop:7829 length:693 start_codon:yes stop_codon:yes gene_type:complete